MLYKFVITIKNILIGSNRYCLDKNYAGVLIIWDRMFGTFEWERDDEKIVYGLVDQPQFFNPLKHQVISHKCKTNYSIPLTSHFILDVLLWKSH